MSSHMARLGDAGPRSSHTQAVIPTEHLSRSLTLQAPWSWNRRPHGLQCNRTTTPPASLKCSFHRDNSLPPKASA